MTPQQFAALFQTCASLGEPFEAERFRLQGACACGVVVGDHVQLLAGPAGSQRLEEGQILPPPLASADAVIQARPWPGRVRRSCASRRGSGCR
jgi:hypothetical protein